MGSLTGKTALVTGGSRGIGRAISERLAREGARVGVHYGSNEGAAAKDTIAAIEAAGGAGFIVQSQLGTPEDAEMLWSGFDQQSDTLDILVNNAGISGARHTIGQVTPDEFDEVFAIDAKAPFFITQRALPRLRDGGRIINLSSGLTHGAASPELIVYAMAKASIDVFTSTLAKELGPRRITANAVAPGVIDTDMNESWLRGNRDVGTAIAALSPLNRVGMPADIADIAAFLASDDSRWITGQWIDASGGALL
ncbi:SDR family oxidoreductase [Arthrobacter sp. NPDC056727]|uniref:SDR family oxidoreductase n=1 Tax=Arthrobacter sp. NPDC056727 TaxID=3345927 RepID=UPI00367170E1